MLSEVPSGAVVRGQPGQQGHTGRVHRVRPPPACLFDRFDLGVPLTVDHPVAGQPGEPVREAVGVGIGVGDQQVVVDPQAS